MTRTRRGSMSFCGRDDCAPCFPVPEMILAGICPCSMPVCPVSVQAAYPVGRSSRRLRDFRHLRLRNPELNLRVKCLSSGCRSISPFDVHRKDLSCGSPCHDLSRRLTRFSLADDENPAKPSPMLLPTGYAAWTLISRDHTCCKGRFLTLRHGAGKQHNFS